MHTDIQDLGGLQRRVDLTVPTGDVEREVSQRLARIASQATMPGFRRGKVPMKMVVASYGSQVHAEVMREKLGDALTSALDAGKVRIAGVPRLEARPGSEDGQIAFSATFEVYPQIQVAELSGLELKRFTCEIAESDVDSTIQTMRRQRAPRVAVERACADGDRVTVDFTGTIDGKAFEGGAAKDFAFNLGEGRMLPEFERALRGLRPGERTDFELTFPADYPAKNLAGRTARFEANVVRVEALELPALDADFARSLGIEDGDLDRMRTELRANVEREVAARLRIRTRDQVFDTLLRVVHFEVPQALVDEEVQRLRTGPAGATASADPGQDDPKMRLVALQRVRLGLLLAELVARNGLQPRQEQVRKEVESIARRYQNPSEVIHWYLSSRERVQEIEAGLTEDNVVNWVLSHAKVSEAAVPFDELMGGRR